MVAQTVELPNLRKMFVPTPGRVIVDLDLERADAQVVAWEADDDKLKQMLRENIDIHTENAKTIFNLKGTVPDEQRQKAKAGVHAVNYGVSAKTLGINLNITTLEADYFIKRWLSAHPKIKHWHQRTERALKTTRKIYNPFGFRRYYFDRYSPKLLHEALGWVPQSTVAIVTNTGLKRIDDAYSSGVYLLLQVHDSLVLEIDEHLLYKTLPKIITLMEVEIPYTDPLVIPINAKMSKKSWGDCVSFEEFKLKEAA